MFSTGNAGDGSKRRDSRGVEPEEVFVETCSHLRYDTPYYCTVLTVGLSPQTADTNMETANFSGFTIYQFRLVCIFPFQDL